MKQICLLLGLLSTSLAWGRLDPQMSDFALNLYKESAKKASGNFMISPYSVQSALGMTAAGAKGETLNQMKGTLGLSKSSDINMHKLFGDLKSQMNRAPGAELLVANKIWAAQDLLYQDAFKTTLMNMYGADVGVLNFARDPSLDINKWVSEQTRQNIKDLIPAGALDANTQMVLTNAVYFKGTWDTKFERKNTEKRDFFVEGKKYVDKKVDLMTVSGGFAYAETNEVMAVELPYEGEEVSLIAIMPLEPSLRLASLEQRLNTASVDAVISQLKIPEEPVKVSLPKFTSVYEEKLKTGLSKLGMKDLFQQGAADLSGIAGSKGDLYVAEVFHKTFIELNEEGTEASGATAVQVDGRSLDLPPEFIANRPFIYFIVHKSTSAILFAGRFSRP